jgi:1-acyl-sn-glycerol-3-phosphate acyltransferase
VDSPTIPHSMLAHWSFPRQSIHEEMFRSPPLSTGERLFAYGIEKLARAVRLYDPIFRWGSFSALMGIVRWYFRIFNRFEIIGRNSIPDRAIFYVNHPGSLDSLLFLAAIGRAVACFIGYENYAFTQMLERLFNFINRDHHKKDWLIEKMIRIILQKNSHFAIWPEGRSPLDGRIMYGFSSVVKVYATLNSHRNIIPLVPVLIEGSGCYRYNLWPRTN